MKDIRTVDITPSWRGVLRLLLEGYSNGTPEGRRIALEELYRMADLADEAVKAVRDVFVKENNS